MTAPITLRCSVCQRDTTLLIEGRCNDCDWEHEYEAREAITAANLEREWRAVKG